MDLAPNGIPFGAKSIRKKVFTMQILYNLIRFIKIFPYVHGNLSISICLSICPRAINPKYTNFPQKKLKKKSTA